MKWQVAAFALAGMLLGAIMTITGVVAISLGAEQEEWLLTMIIGLGIHLLCLGLVVEIKDIKRD